MPLVYNTPSTGMAEAYGRAVTPTPPAAGNVAADSQESARTAPAGAGPAAVVSISEAAQTLSDAFSGSKPGINNGTMASEDGGGLSEQRNMLTERYDAQAARLNESPS